MRIALVISDRCGLNVLPLQEESVMHEMQNLKRELKELTDRHDYAKVSVVTKRLTVTNAPVMQPCTGRRSMFACNFRSLPGLSSTQTLACLLVQILRGNHDVTSSQQSCSG